MPRLSSSTIFLDPSKVRLTARAVACIENARMAVGADLVPVLTLSQSTLIERADGTKLGSVGPSIDLGFFKLSELSKEHALLMSQDSILFQLPLELSSEEKLEIDFESEFYIVGVDLDEFY